MPIESLVFKGGGIRGLGYIGATRALFEALIMPGVKRVAGSSAGAVTAIVIGLGYQQESIASLVSGVDMADLEDTNGLSGVAKFSKLLRNGYINEGDKLLAKLREVIKSRITAVINNYQQEHPENLAQLAALAIDPDHVTFKNISDLSQLIPEAGIKDIYITGTRLPGAVDHTFQLEIFSIEDTPDMEVALAGRISISMPKFFKPVEWNGSQYVDGGCLKNFPIEIFDDVNNPRYKPQSMYKYLGDHCQNLSTLGIRIDTDDVMRDLLFSPARSKTIRDRLIGNFIDHVAGLPCTKSNDNIEAAVREHYCHTTCQLNDEKIALTDFKLTDEKKNRLIQRGYQDMSAWIKNYYQKAVESTLFSSFHAMCENMSETELKTLCDELLLHPQEILVVAGALTKKYINNFLTTAQEIQRVKIAANQIIHQHINMLDDIFHKYKINIDMLRLRLAFKHETSDEKIWIALAEEMMKIISHSSKNPFIKKDDIKYLTTFITEVKSCVMMLHIKPQLVREKNKRDFTAVENYRIGLFSTRRQTDDATQSAELVFRNDNNRKR